MQTSADNLKTVAAPAGPIPLPALENLAARLRPSGLHLLTLGVDGNLAYTDQNANVFFQRYVLPIVQWRESIEDKFRDCLKAITATSSPVIWNFVPGVIVAAFPFVERRALTGIILLAGRTTDFKMTEDVVRLCSRLGVDGIWLSQQADHLASYTDDAMLRQAHLLQSMLRDQIRLTSLEHEVDSISAQLSNTYEELSLIYQISGGMRVNRTPVEFFKQACLDVMDVIGVRGIGVAMAPGFAPLKEPLLYGSLSLPPGSIHRLGTELIEALEQRRTPLLINNLRKDKSFHWLSGSAEQMLAVPLQRQDQVLGCLFGLDKLTGEFDTVDSKLLNSIANESAVYLENAMLYGDVQDLLMGILHSLVSAVDAKDAYTCGHSERVALLSRLLAQEANLGDAFISRVYMAGLLHDVGKIGVPEVVLQKPGRLTPEEFEQIKKHPEIGARILRDIRQLEDILPGVLHHHERYDGRGYPTGLSGENIPLMGRVICLADCFDAMTSSRTYRKALPLEVALTEIRRCSGTQFDPALTDVFVSIGADRFREELHQHKHQTRHILEMQQHLRAA